VVIGEHEPHFRKHLEMSGHCGLADRYLRHDLADVHGLTAARK
jgi:hypothetical protein